MDQSRQRSDRRSSQRFGLRCQALLFRHGAPEPVRANVLNIGTKGMYWVSLVCFVPLETVRCIVYLAPDIVFECAARVVRIEAGAGEFGAGAGILAYAVTAPGTAPEILPLE